jgi:hypothetical protein
MARVTFVRINDSTKCSPHLIQRGEKLLAFVLRNRMFIAVFKRVHFRSLSVSPDLLKYYFKVHFIINPQCTARSPSQRPKTYMCVTLK